MKVITNWNIFKELVPTITERIEYKGNPIDVGTKLNLNWGSKGIEFKLKVSKVKYDISSGTFEYVLDCYKGKPHNTKQELHFKLLKLGYCSTFLEFKHVFKEVLGNEHINIIIDEKKKIISTLKRQLERKNY